MRWFLYDWLCAVWLVDLAIFAKARCYVETRVEKRLAAMELSGNKDRAGSFCFSCRPKRKNSTDRFFCEINSPPLSD